MFSEVSPVWLALTSAVLFAFGAHLQNVGLARVRSDSGAAISIASSAVLFWLMAPFLLNGANWSQSAVWIFVLTGLFRPAISANLAVAGMRFLGPTLASTLSSTSPLFGAALGVLWLGESLSWATAVGTAGIIAAVVMLAKRGVRAAVTWPLWALGLPVGAAALRSVGHVLSKIGLEGIPDPYFAGLVAFSVSAMVMIAVHRIRPTSQPIQWRGGGPFWFVAAGVVMGISVLSLNTALMRGQIVTVVPIVACSPVFTMLLSVLVFRRENLTPRTVLAVFAVVPSVILIALSS
ncbi:MAG: EamA family transporter [Alphaproteobacteria bacterium]